ncbi:hypothetical protein [Leptolyngbya sp. 7M]|uniref:hypothetical protein n=1 Tax=Leptolyngbya sp. 7M TaxID=2812896 RepID=UPI001B8B11D2|nr:hypothetical protein [Leptolyngbya sp. 7M]QYO62677.1 hypothetical protein JVX88_21860 [Leptolyngbya sp. 7M]
MSGQICWLEGFATNGEKILHMRLQPHEPWKPYTAFPGLSVPDYDIPRGSKGWATCQMLLKAGWKLIPSDQAKARPAMVPLASATQR